MLARLLSFWKGHFSGVMLNWVVVSNIFLFSPLPGEDEPILTSIFFSLGLEKTTKQLNFRRVKNSVEYILLFLPSSSGERRRKPFRPWSSLSGEGCPTSAAGLVFLRYQDTDARQDAILKSSWADVLENDSQKPSQKPMKFNDFADCMWFTVMWDFGVGPYGKNPSFCRRSINPWNSCEKCIKLNFPVMTKESCFQT